LGIALFASVAAVGTSEAQASTVQPAPEKYFDIAPQGLSGALLEMSRQANVDVMASESLTHGQTAPAVHGSMTPARALSRVLANANLSYRASADGGFIVESKAGRPGTIDVAQNASPPTAASAPVATAPDASSPTSKLGASGAVEQVIVTAQRRAEGIENVPMSVQAFGGDTLNNLNIHSTDQLQFATPGFVNTGTAGDGISSIYIRGVGSAYSGPGLEGSVATYVDDVYLQTQTQSAQNVIDVSQVQVLKGPQGVLYGRNATGGAVLITTEDPKLDTTEGYVKAGLGNLDWKRAEGVVNVPLTDTLALRAAGFYDYRSGYVENIAVPNFNKSGVGAGRTYSARVKLLWEPTDDFKAVATFQYDRRNGNGAIHSLRYNPDGTPTGLGFYQTTQSPNREGGGGDDTDALLGSVHMDYTRGIWTVTDTAAYRRTRAFGCTDNDGVVAEELYFCTVSQNSPNPGTADGLRNDTFTNELRVETNSGGPFDVTAGFFAERNQARFVGRIGGSFFGAATPTFDNHDNLTAWSPYVEAYYNITDKLKFTAGVRYTHESKYHSDINDADAIATLGVPTGGNDRTSFSNVSPRAVLSYDAGTMNYYVSYNRGFKSGGFNSPSLTVDPPLKPETISAWEGGAKYLSEDGRLRASGAMYYYDWKNMQVAFIVGGGTGIMQQNAADSKIYGGEFNLDWSPSSDWQIGLGAAYTHARFASFPDAAVYDLIGGYLTATAENLKDFRLPEAPDFTGNASVTYNFNLPANWAGTATLAARYTTQYDFTAGAGGELRASRQKPFALVNLSGTVFPEQANWEFGWFVSNLFEQHYIQLVSTGNTGVYMTPAEPRTYGMTVTYRFGG
jgi:iron complex outermembrane receptor protein